MLDIKISENKKDSAPLKDGQLADKMFYMRHIEYGDWYLESVTYRDMLPVFPRPAPQCASISVNECIRVSRAGDELYAVNADAAIERFCENAKAYRLPTVPREDIFEALSVLSHDQMSRLDDSSLFLAFLQLNAAQTGEIKKAAHGAEFTISLEYVNRPDTVIPMRALAGTCPVEDGGFGVMYDTAAALSNFTACDKDFDVMLWLDGVYQKYISGLAGMDLFVRMGDRVIIPGSAFESVFGRCMAELLSGWSIPVEREKLSIDELFKQKENIEEIFAVSASKGVRAVTEIEYKEQDVKFESGKLTKKLADTLTNIEKNIYPPVKGMITKL